MENYTAIRNLFVLECLRKVTDNCIPFPLEGAWLDIGQEIAVLLEEDLIVAEDKCYKLSPDGKKALYLFDEERKVMLKPLEQFKEVLIKGELTDGRIPMMSFLFTHSGTLEVAEMMRSAIFSIKWNEMVQTVAELNTIPDSKWQNMIAQDSFFKYVDDLADPHAWKSLGDSEEEAEATGMWLFNPGFIQITAVQ